MQVIADLLDQARQATGIEEVFHQVLVAARPDVGDHRHLAACALEIVEPDLLPRTPCHRDQMDDGVGRAADRHRHGDGVEERIVRQDLLRRQVFPDHADDAPAAFRGHADVTGIGRRDRGGAGQRHAERLGHRHHGGGRPHGHASAVAPRDAAFDIDPVRIGDLAGPTLVPVFPGVRARAQHLALDVATQHRPGRQVDRGQSHADRAEQQRRRGLVATAHQHDTIHGVPA